MIINQRRVMAGFLLIFTFVAHINYAIKMYGKVQEHFSSINGGTELITTNQKNVIFNDCFVKFRGVRENPNFAVNMLLPTNLSRTFLSFCVCVCVFVVCTV